MEAPCAHMENAERGRPEGAGRTSFVLTVIHLKHLLDIQAVLLSGKLALTDSELSGEV